MQKEGWKNWCRKRCIARLWNKHSFRPQEALHQVDKREFHFPRGTFLAYHPRRLSQLLSLLPLQLPHLLFFTGRPKALSACSVKPYYTFAVRRTGLPEVKTIFQRRHFCPCPQCTSGDYHRGMYKEFLGRCKIFVSFSPISIPTYWAKHSEKCTPLLF